VIDRCLVQDPTGDPKQESGPGLVPARMLLDAGEQEPVQLAKSLLVQRG
jgi:hypothetical protein